MSPSIGVLLINLGTPETLSVSSVRCYLRRFLSDKRVIELPFLARMLLVNGIIAPFRAKKSFQAYQKIWQEEGSPLRFHSQTLAKKLQATLGKEFRVELGMRYGTPSLSAAIEKLVHCQKLIVLPLYPQYASSTSGSSIEYVLKQVARQKVYPSIAIIREFYQHPSYISAVCKPIKEAMAKSPNAQLVLSYHGLPEKQVKADGCKAICQSSCSQSALNKVPHCYRGQCFQTSELIRQHLQLAPKAVTTCFQSRLGRLPWIKPYTDDTLGDLRQKGVKNVVVACPAFTADCLETLEEIALVAKGDWLDKGGENFHFVPSLNASDDWVQALTHLI